MSSGAKPRVDIVFEMRLFRLPFGCFLPKWQAFEVTNNITLTGFRVSIAALDEEKTRVWL